MFLRSFLVCLFACGFFCFLVDLLSVALVYTAQPRLLCRPLIKGLKLSAAVFPTLKLQNSEVISGSHHVDQLVEENKKSL